MNLPDFSMVKPEGISSILIRVTGQVVASENSTDSLKWPSLTRGSLGYSTDDNEVVRSKMIKQLELRKLWKVIELALLPTSCLVRWYNLK